MLMMLGLLKGRHLHTILHHQNVPGHPWTTFRGSASTRLRPSGRGKTFFRCASDALASNRSLCSLIIKQSSFTGCWNDSNSNCWQHCQSRDADSCVWNCVFWLSIRCSCAARPIVYACLYVSMPLESEVPPAQLCVQTGSNECVWREWPCQSRVKQHLSSPMLLCTDHIVRIRRLSLQESRRVEVAQKETQVDANRSVDSEFPPLHYIFCVQSQTPGLVHTVYYTLLHHVIHKYT